MFTGTLHPYQYDAVTAILERRTLLVAYSMGTGKTVLTIAALEELLGSGEIDRVLLLVPAGLKFQWACSIARFTDVRTCTLRVRGTDITIPAPEHCVIVDGDADRRTHQWEMARELGTEYIIASHGAVLHDWDQLVATRCDAVVLDEATVIKNFEAMTTRRVKSLTPPARIALTGTPLENKPEEIFSVMEWVDATTLGQWQYFDPVYIDRDGYGGVTGYHNLDLLHARLRRSMVRKSRLDPEVAAYLPAVTETTRTVALDRDTRRVYRRITDDLTEALDECADAGSPLDLAAYYAGTAQPTEGNPARNRVMARLLAARMLLDHPALLADSAAAYARGEGEGSAYVAELLAADPRARALKATPKVDVLVAVLTEMLSEPAIKVVVFTNYRRLLPHLAGRVAHLGGLVTYDGSMGAAARSAATTAFEGNPGVRMLLATNAGGYGLDLPAASYVVNVDLPDSRGVLDQRNSRHVRASSLHSRVYVVNLVVAGSVEERQQAVLAMRGRLAAAVVDGRGTGSVAADVPRLAAHLAAE